MRLWKFKKIRQYKEEIITRSTCGAFDQTFIGKGQSLANE